MSTIQSPSADVTASPDPQTVTLEEALARVARPNQILQLPGVSVHRCGRTAPHDAIQALLCGSDADQQRARAAVAHIQDLVRQSLKNPRIEVTVT